VRSPIVKLAINEVIAEVDRGVGSSTYASDLLTNRDLTTVLLSLGFQMPHN
jgi:hypothetical protein